ncbi:Hypothetical protein POVN_LOCUS702 [uncultured virus]|nr:Hypothetical protein POVN_LOCUS702 [uncultured virus]
MATLTEYKQSLDFIRQLYTALAEDYALRVEGKKPVHTTKALDESAAGLVTIRQRLGKTFTELGGGKMGSILPPKSPAKTDAGKPRAATDDSKYLMSIRVGDTVYLTPPLPGRRNNIPVEDAIVQYNPVTGALEATIELAPTATQLEEFKRLNEQYRAAHKPMPGNFSAPMAATYPTGLRYTWIGEQVWQPNNGGATVHIDFTPASTLTAMPTDIEEGSVVDQPSEHARWYVDRFDPNAKTLLLRFYQPYAYMGTPEPRALQWTNQRGWFDAKAQKTRSNIGQGNLTFRPAVVGQDVPVPAGQRITIPLPSQPGQLPTF